MLPPEFSKARKVTTAGTDAADVLAVCFCRGPGSANGADAGSARAGDGGNLGPAPAGGTDGPALPLNGQDARDPAGTVWYAGAFRSDPWASAQAGEPLPDRPVIVSRQRWLAERARLMGRNAPLGLRIEAGERVDDLAGDLTQFSLIALAFPTFTDGRAFSTARLLRDKYTYRGELRAVGNVLSDLIPFMRRVGIDSFEV
ncbi:MAG: DUF934 domain-containing protein, partial [Hyphomicrobiaceae bacterium]|nr:DUF934 domain-containing protein [Hyphomicrobiaceae bacterium]